jgi:hypothetical protein
MDIPFGVDEATIACARNIKSSLDSDRSIVHIEDALDESSALGVGVELEILVRCHRSPAEQAGLQSTDPPF